MTVRTSARQYAAALFDVARQNDRVDVIQRDLALVASTVAAHDDLQRVLTDRTVSSNSKAEILGAVADRLGVTADEVRRLLAWLADRDRLALLAEIDHAFGTRVLEAGRTVQAEITTTAPLDTSSRDALKDALGRALDRHVIMTERVDPSIVGGMVAKVGSVVFDGSVTRHIERFREQLLSGR